MDAMMGLWQIVVEQSIMVYSIVDAVTVAVDRSVTEHMIIPSFSLCYLMVCRW